MNVNGSNSRVAGQDGFSSSWFVESGDSLIPVFDVATVTQTYAALFALYIAFFVFPMMGLIMRRNRLSSSRKRSLKLNLFESFGGEQKNI